MGKITKSSKSQSLHNYMNSNNNYLKKIKDQCTLGYIYTVLESTLQPTRFGDVLMVSVANSKNNKVTKTFLPVSMVTKLKDFFREKGDGELGNDSVVGSMFKYVGEIKMKNGNSFSKLEWLEDEDTDCKKMGID